MKNFLQNRKKVIRLNVNQFIWITLYSIVDSFNVGFRDCTLYFFPVTEERKLSGQNPGKRAPTKEKKSGHSDNIPWDSYLFNVSFTRFAQPQVTKMKLKARKQHPSKKRAF